MNSVSNYIFSRDKKVFTSTWDTRNTSSGSSSSNQIKLPIIDGTRCNFIVYWGDGSKTLVLNYDETKLTHTYATEGVYTITIKGIVKGFSFNNGGDKLKLTSLDNCTGLKLPNDEGWFHGCENLSYMSEDLGTSHVTYFKNCWYNCFKLTSFPLIDTSNATRLTNTWYNCYGLTSFPLIDTSKVEVLLLTWYNCYGLTSFPSINTFNARIIYGAWAKCGNLTSFPLIDTSNVTSMLAAWLNCYGLTSFPLIDASKVEILERTWKGCYGLINFPITNFSKGRNFSGVFQNSSIPVNDYSNILISLSKNNLYDNLTLDAHGLKYNSSATEDRNKLIARGWVIEDSGLAS